MNNFRCRNFSGVFYPESCPSDFHKVIEDFGVKCCLSPLHEPDEEQKKPHYHIIFMFSGNKNIEQVRLLMYKLGSAMVQPVNDISAMVRYLIHKDNPEKQQFDKSEIICYHNVQIDKYFKQTEKESLDTMRKLIEIININKITKYNELINFCCADNDLLKACLKYAYAINQFMRGV